MIAVDVPIMPKKRENGLSAVRHKIMDMASVVIGAIGFAGGVAADWLRQWSQSCLARRDVRVAIRAEINPVLVHLNFFILAAMDGSREQDPMLVNLHFAHPLRLQAFEYYWQDHRDRLLTLPEWPRLQGWVEALNRVGDDPGSTLFRAIMLFEGLTIHPLDRCVSRDSKKFIRRVLDRPEVAKYMIRNLVKKADL